ncbi:MAG TPA: choice-of-anchor D domain-containing protein [Candidatus Kapabacteria bacterium]|nr:choice-of-anchor D domain-containing protein [Candidatus Kapabacteria bacterium]
MSLRTTGHILLPYPANRSIALAVFLFLTYLFSYKASAQGSGSREEYGSTVSYSSFAPTSARTAKQVRFFSTAKAALPQGGLQPVYKTSGKDFYLAFPSAVGTDIVSDPPYKRLYISARSTARGSVSLVGGGWQQSYVTNPNTVTEIDLPVWAGLDRNETEQIYQRVFEVQSEDEIAVYALSHHHYSTDGFLILPVEALGTMHTIASARNALFYLGGRVLPLNQFTFDTVPRSEFLIVGTNDNTTVTVTPSANSWGGKFLQGKDYTFTLNRGETIEIAAHDTAATGLIYNTLYWIGKLLTTDCDLTGSIVSSDKPIAVFSGHERASIPDSLEFAWAGHPSVSRDHIIDQMPPAENWGKTFAFIPSSLGTHKSRAAAGDVVRVIAGYDLTDVSVNGSLVASLARGKFLQLTLNKASLITTSQPALVVKYLQTANEPDTLGDPDMTVLPPIENMSTFYTLPTLSGNGSFTEHYISIICDSSALTTTLLNGIPLDQSKLFPLAGTKFYYTVLQVNPGTQRVESPLPCYAEVYGYGYFDSYSFSGGGSFDYIHGLSAIDLDFGRVQVGSKHDSNSYIIASNGGASHNENSEIYHYSWESGDTTAFAILDTIRLTTPLAPGKKLPVFFRFTPPYNGSYHAILRVWSNNHEPVFINVYGQAAQGQLKLSVTSIDFAHVRIGLTPVLPFTISNIGGSALTIFNPDLAPYWTGTAFSMTKVISAKQTNVLDVGENVTIPVTFTPTAHQEYSLKLPINSDGGSDTVLILGRGVDYNIPTTLTNFGTLRIRPASYWQKDTMSGWQLIQVKNTGDDTTSILSVSLSPIPSDNTSNLSDWELYADSLPSAVRNPWFLDTVLSSKNRNIRYYRVRFTPQLNPLDTGIRTMLVKIQAPGVGSGVIRSYYDTLTGIGAEPYVIATPQIIDFGTYSNPTQNLDTKFDTLINIGSFDGTIDSLRHNDTAFFVVTSQTLPLPDNTPIAKQQQVHLQVDFKIKQVGDFYDTIYAYNDSRSEPVILIRAKVRTGIDTLPQISLGTISNCTPIDTMLRIHNSTRVKIEIDSVLLSGDSGGFTLPDRIILPIYIDADSEFDLHVRYIFPIDSLNGIQKAFIILKIPAVIGTQSIGYVYDTAYLTITRKVNQLDLVTQPPAYNPSAGDAPFRLPVYLHGSRLGYGELDFDTVKIQFSNDLIAPIGIDRTGSLTEIGATVPVQPNFTWDPITRIFCIPMYNVGISQNASSNDLLFTVLCQAYLTPDTTVGASVAFGYYDKPCAFRVAPYSEEFTYADECGNRTIRDLLLGTKPSIVISEPYPNPVENGSDGVSIGYVSPMEYIMNWQVADAQGKTTMSQSGIHIKQGQGVLTIPPAAYQASGTYYVTISVVDASYSNTSLKVQKSITTKFSVIK